MKYDVIAMVYNRSWKELNRLIEDGNIKVEDVTKVVIETKNAYFIYKFACHVEGAPIDELARALIETKDAEYICYFAEYVKGAPIDELAQAVIETKNAKYICYFAEYIKGAPIKDLAQAVIETKNAKYIYYFARYVKGAPIDELAQGIIETKNAECIFRFAHDIKEAPIEMFVNALIELKSYIHIGLILSKIGSKHTDHEYGRNRELKIYAFEHKDRLLAVLTECTDIVCLHTIRHFLNDDGIVGHVDQLILKLEQEQDANLSTQSAAADMSETEQLEEAGFDMLSPDGDGTRDSGPRRTRELPTNKNNLQQ